MGSIMDSGRCRTCGYGHGCCNCPKYPDAQPHSAQLVSANEQMSRQVAQKREQEIEQMRRMRALRLDHWRKCVAARNRARVAEARAEAVRTSVLKGMTVQANEAKRYAKELERSAEEQHAIADDHLDAVITLNYYFEAGDTAEQDAAK